MDQPACMKRVIVCVNRRTNPEQPSCGARGGEALADRLEREIAARGWAIEVERFHCLGHCLEGPNLKLAPGGRIIGAISPDKMTEVLREIEAFSMMPDRIPSRPSGKR